MSLLALSAQGDLTALKELLETEDVDVSFQVRVS